MAHEIDMSNDRANMAYLGEIPWHKLGQSMPENASIEQWIHAAGMDYEIKHAPVQYTNGSIHTYTGKRVLYRSDTNAPLGVVSDAYKAVQPAAVLEFFRGLCETNSLKMETAGVLRGGAIYWALAKTGHEINLAGDRTHGYLMLSSTADGSRATDARFTSVRVVCANTLAVAMYGSVKPAGAVRTRHTSVFDASATKKKLNLDQFDSSWLNFKAQMEALCNVKVSPNEAREFFTELLRPADQRAKPRAAIGASTLTDLLGAPLNTPQEKTATDRAVRGLEDMVKSYYAAPGAVPGTAYGLVQGVTHFIDHVRGGDDTRMASAWFGQGDTLKTTALNNALALV